MGGCCSANCCGGGDNTQRRPLLIRDTEKRPWKRKDRKGTDRVGTATAKLDQNSSHSTSNFSERTEDQGQLIFKNCESLLNGTLSTRSGSLPFNYSKRGHISSFSTGPEDEQDELEDEYDNWSKSAVSQLLVQVTEQLADQDNDASGEQEIQLSPRSACALFDEYSSIEEQERQQLPVFSTLLTRALEAGRTNSNIAPVLCLKATHNELCQLESELFAHFARADYDTTSPINLRSCIHSKHLHPTYARMLLLNLRKLLSHPALEKAPELRSDLRSLVVRLEQSLSSPYPSTAFELTSEDAGTLLEVISTTNLPIFDPVSTPPLIFNERETPLVAAALRVARASLDLREMADTQTFKSSNHRELLRDAGYLVSASDQSSCPSAKSFAKLIPAEDKVLLTSILHDLAEQSKGLAVYRLPSPMVSDLHQLTDRFGLLALQCAKVKVSKALYVVKNRFKLKPEDFKRVCVIEPLSQQLILDALVLILASNIQPTSETQKLKNLKGKLEAIVDAGDPKTSCELNEDEASFLEHMLTLGLDYNFHREFTCHSTTSDSVNPHFVAEENKTYGCKGVYEPDIAVESVVPVSSSQINAFFESVPMVMDTEKTDAFLDDMSTYNPFGDPFTQPKSLKHLPEGNTKYIDVEEADLIRPVHVETTGRAPSTSSLSRRPEAQTDLTPASRQTEENTFIFRLLNHALMLQCTLEVLQRNSMQPFSYKLAPFQVLQLCDSVRKLSSITPSTDDSKLIKNLSMNADLHSAVRLNMKTMHRLREFHARVFKSVIQDSMNRLASIQESISSSNQEENLPPEDAFSLAEICCATRFNYLDSLSVFFLHQIQSRSMAISDSLLPLTPNQLTFLNQEAHQTYAQLQQLEQNPTMAAVPNDISLELLNLYKLRALAQSPEIVSEQIQKRLLWRHALSQFFLFHPEKGLKKIFSEVALNVFVYESETWEGDLKANFITEVGKLIDSTERRILVRPEDLNTWLGSKREDAGTTSCLATTLKASLVSFLLKNRETKVDIGIITPLIVKLVRSQSIGSGLKLSESEIDLIRAFVPKQSDIPPTYILDKPAEKEWNKERADLERACEHDLLVTESTALVKVAHFQAGIAQASARSQLLQILLIETISSGLARNIFPIGRSLFANFVHPTGETSEPTQERAELNAQLETTTKSQTLQDIRDGLKEIFTREKLLTSPECLSRASNFYNDLPTMQPSTTTGGDLSRHFERLVCLQKEQKVSSAKLEPLISSNEALLFSLLSFQALSSTAAQYQPDVESLSYLVFALSVCRRHLATSEAIIPALEALDKRARTILSGFVPSKLGEVDLQTISQLQHLLTERLTPKLAREITECLKGISVNSDISKNKLRFIVFAAVLLPTADTRVKLLALALCQILVTASVSIPAGDLPTQPNNSATTEVLSSMQTGLSCPRPYTADRSRLLLALFPSSQEERNTWKWDLLTFFQTIFAATLLPANSTSSLVPNNLILKAVWLYLFEGQGETLPESVLLDELLDSLLYHNTTVWADENKVSFFEHLFKAAPQIPTDIIPSVVELTTESFEQIHDTGPTLPSDSHFPSLQAHMIAEVLYSHMRLETPLSFAELLLLYHALATVLRSKYLRGQPAAKIGITYGLHQIEWSLSTGNLLPPTDLCLSKAYHEAFAKATLLDSRNETVEDLRSLVAPTILSSEDSGPLGSLDLRQVSEGLRALLTGLFLLSPSDAKSASELLLKASSKPCAVNHESISSALSPADVARTHTLFENLFALDMTGPLLTRGLDLNFDVVLNCAPPPKVPVAAELAASILAYLSSKNEINSPEESKLFFHAVVLLSYAARSSTSSIPPRLHLIKTIVPQQLLQQQHDQPGASDLTAVFAVSVTSDMSTETVVSSPTESFASFSACSLVHPEDRFPNQISPMEMPSYDSKTHEVENNVFFSMDSLPKNSITSITSSSLVDTNDEGAVKASPDTLQVSAFAKLLVGPEDDAEWLLRLTEAFHCANIILAKSSLTQLSHGRLFQAIRALDRSDGTHEGQVFLKAFPNQVSEMRELPLSKSQTSLLTWLTAACQDRLKKALPTLIAYLAHMGSLTVAEKDKLVSLIFAYFSLNLPVADSLLMAAAGLLAIKLNNTKGQLVSEEVQEFAKNLLSMPPTEHVADEELGRTAVALQATWKASENLPLTLTEQICLAYTKLLPDTVLPELDDAIFSSRSWPMKLDAKQRNHLQRKCDALCESLADISLDALHRKGPNAENLSALLAASDLLHSCEPRLRTLIELSGSHSDPLTTRLIDTVMRNCQPRQTFRECATAILALLDYNTQDAFIVLSPREAVQLAEDIEAIGEALEDLSREELARARNRLYLATACFYATANDDISSPSSVFELPVTYLGLHSLLTCLSSARPVQRMSGVEPIPPSPHSTASPTLQPSNNLNELSSDLKQQNKPSPPTDEITYLIRHPPQDMEILTSKQDTPLGTRSQKKVTGDAPVVIAGSDSPLRRPACSRGKRQRLFSSQSLGMQNLAWRGRGRQGSCGVGVGDSGPFLSSSSMLSLPLNLAKSGSSLFTASDLSLNAPRGKSSLDRLYELVEIRRAVVAGSLSELNLLGRTPSSFTPCWPMHSPSSVPVHRPYGWWRRGNGGKVGAAAAGPSTPPSKVDLGDIRQKCAENTLFLLNRAAFEEDEAHACFHTVEANLRIASALKTPGFFKIADHS
ncbi:hypothetical protein SprV_0401521100 [Sparganum proliferum]